MTQPNTPFTSPPLHHSNFIIWSFGIITSLLVLVVLIFPTDSLSLGSQKLSEPEWLLSTICVSILCGILSAAHLASDTSPGLSGIRRLSLFVLLLFAITATIRTSIPLITTNSDTLEIFVALPLPAIVLVATVLLGFNTGILLTLTSAFFGVFVTAHIPTVQASEVVLIFSVLLGGGLSASFVALGARRINDYLKGGFTISIIVFLSAAFILPMTPQYDVSQFIFMLIVSVINGLLSLYVIHI